MTIRMVSAHSQRNRLLHQTLTQATSFARPRRSRKYRSCSFPAATAPIALSPSDREALLRQRALMCAQQGLYAEAIALFSLLIERNPGSASYFNNRGLLHFQTGEFEQALVDYSQAIQLNPRLTKLYNNRANCYSAMQELLLAIADYDTAIDLDPRNVHAWINQGITYRELEQYEQAIENFDLALQVGQFLYKSDSATNDEGYIYAERGRAYHLRGDWNAAIADYRRSLNCLTLTRSTAASRLYRRVENWLGSLLEPMSA